MTIKRLIVANSRPDTRDELRYRFADIEARRLAALEMDARYPEITQENFRQACRDQETTIEAIRDFFLSE